MFCYIYNIYKITKKKKNKIRNANNFDMENLEKSVFKISHLGLLPPSLNCFNTFSFETNFFLKISEQNINFLSNILMHFVYLRLIDFTRIESLYYLNILKC